MRAWGLWLLPLTTPGCIDPGIFVCDDDPQCPRGQCVVGNCVVEDSECEFGRYSRYAQPDLAGRCYEPDDASTGTSVASTGTDAPGSTSDTGTASTAVAAESSSGAPVPVELCNGIDDDANGLVDEWSPENDRCEICPPDNECKWCDLFPDDVADPQTFYYLCSDANYDEFVGFCAALGAPITSIHDDVENTFLSIKVAEFTPYARANIGLRDFGDVGAPAWTWVDGSEFSYERLGDDLTMHAEGDVCVHLRTSADWDATHCNNGQPFICEAPRP